MNSIHSSSYLFPMGFDQYGLLFYLAEFQAMQSKMREVENT